MPQNFVLSQKIAPLIFESSKSLFSQLFFQAKYRRNFICNKIDKQEQKDCRGIWP